MTERQEQFMELYRRGLSDAEVARRMGISPGTVRNWRKKFGLPCRANWECRGKRSDTICWTCQNACGGCSWSRNYVPVEGWIAEKTIRRYTDDHGFRLVESYNVLYCPSYRPDPPREPVLPGPTPLAIKPPPARDPCVGCNNFGLCSNRGWTCKDKATWEVAHG